MSEYKRLTNKDWKENYDIFEDVDCDTCTEDCGECERSFNALVRLAELCLLATKGNPHRVSKSVKQIVLAPRGRHSEKPAEVRDRITALMGGGTKIELFARQHADGWDCWGLEAPDD